ncbi:MAG TPA: DEAD/DEAH box helicase family protein [Candidatus Paceibacterota bacterium]
MAISEQELKYREWKEKPDFPNLDERAAFYAKTFIERIRGGEDFPKPLYPHQVEAILRVIYHGEKLGRWDSLLDIVTGGGKTVIMAGLVAYFWQVRGCEKFLVLVPNTIVRERVKDDFEIRSPSFAYTDFPFFFNSHTKIPSRISCKVLRDGSDAVSIRDANIIIGNIHQLYEGRQSQSLEMLLSPEVVTKIVIFNDEAHNAAADQYREVLKLLRDKTIARIDLTATPYRLDKEDLDTYPPIYEYHVEEAIRDRVVKQIVVTKPDIESVKLQYEEWDEKDQVVKVLDAEEMPWEQIEVELKRGGAVRFVTAKNARRQQLMIAQATVDYQLKQIPPALDGKGPQWWPLLLVVSLSQKDAALIYETLQQKPFQYKAEELLLVHSKQDEMENKKAFLLGRKSPEGLSKEDEALWHEARKIKVIIAVSMLREGWDVRNISAICLFRKFSYQKKGDMIYTVYGPQIIGRGLRRIRPPTEPDHLFVADHPAFNHDWLWKLLSAQQYAKPLNPGDAVDTSEIQDIPATQKTTEENGTKAEEANVLDIEAVIKSLPDIANIEPMKNWQAHFTTLVFDKRVSSALQKITNVKSRLLGTDRTAHEIPDDVVNAEELNKIETDITKKSRAQLIEEITSDISNEPHQALMSTFRQETAAQLHALTGALEWILKEKFEMNGISEIDSASDATLQRMHFYLPQIFEEFRRPEIILGILESK